MADTVDIVADAIQSAESGETVESTGTESVESGASESTGEESSTGSDEGSAGSGAGAVSPSSGAAATAPAEIDAAKLPPADAVSEEDAKEFAKYGITPPKPGQREGTFKWSKVQKVVENARKKTAEKYEQRIATHESQIAKMSDQLRNMEALERMVEEPERYIRVLAALHPDKYSKYLNLTGGEAAPAGRTTAGSGAGTAADPKPEPDSQFPDGSYGYSPEATDKLLEWNRREGKREAIAEMEKRFGPIEQDWKQSRIQRDAEMRRQQAIPGVHAQILNSKKVWGKLFQSKVAGDKEDDPEIVKALAEHPDWSFEACIAHVLTPRLQANRESMRKELLDEINKAPAAASRMTPGGGGSGASGTRSTADIVRDAIAAASRG